jgi:hypothetical protein
VHSKSFLATVYFQRLETLCLRVTETSRSTDEALTMTEFFTPQHARPGCESNPAQTDRTRPSKQGKRFAGGLSILTICVVLWPISQNWRNKPADSFPLSYYPMFSAYRSESAEVTYLRSVDAQGNTQPLRYSYAGSGGLNQVRRQIRKTVRAGKTDELCQSVAAKVARRKNALPANLTSIQIVTGDYKLDEYFGGNKTPGSEKVHATCQVTGGKQ